MNLVYTRKIEPNESYVFHIYLRGKTGKTFTQTRTYPWITDDRSAWSMGRRIVESEPNVEHVSVSKPVYAFASERLGASGQAWMPISDNEKPPRRHTYE